jgi:hypothetical protein
MEKFEQKIAGHLFCFTPIMLSNDLQYFVSVDDASFKMVSVEYEFRIVNPDSISSWITGLEEQLSDTVLSYIAQAA